jgi:hypothetical protein
MRLRIFLLLLCLPLAAARAQGDIHRCIGANGIPVFTDRVCSDVNASPLLPPAAASSAPVSSTPVQPPPPVLCASDTAHLKQAVIDAFADRNPNRLAAIMLWNDEGQQAVVADIRVFSQLMAHPLIGVTVEGESDAGDDSDASSGAPASVPPDNAPAHGGSLLVRTESEDGSGATEQTRFDIVHRDGCLWLHPQS